MGDLFNTL